MRIRKQYKIVTESNTVRFIMAWKMSEARVKMYQLVGSENFTIRLI